MSDTLSKSVNIKLTKEQRKEIGKLADSKGLTLKDLVLNSTIYSKKDSKVAQLEKEVKELKEQLEGLERDSQQLEQVEAVLSAKDKHIITLKDQLEKANNQLADITRLLDQQQNLSLASQRKIKELEEVTASTNKSKGFFARLFSGI